MLVFLSMPNDVYMSSGVGSNSLNCPARLFDCLYRILSGIAA
jgi:hypothetical protein